MHILDLPNEMLLCILKKLDNVDVLHSLFGINNERLHTLVQNNEFNHRLNFASYRSTDDSGPVTDSILDRLCVDILPRISYKIKCLVLEPLSMERILLAVTYSNLSEIQLFKFRQEICGRYFRDDSPFRHIFKEQITDLILMNNDEYIEKTLLKDYTTNVYAHILIFFENLTHLSIIQSSDTRCPPLTLCDLSSTIFSSSILTKLCTNVSNFNDCLLILDGRLNQLTTFIVKIDNINNPEFIICQENNLPNLKCFSLTCHRLTCEYDHRVVPLLRRMLNLEKLTLYLNVQDRAGFIDGTHLHNEILVYMLRLHTFIFYISTKNVVDESVQFLSSDDVQKTFIGISYLHVGCVVDYLSTARGLCHVFSLPFAFDRIERITNKFPTNVFNRVTYLLVYDIFAFKHEFFIRLTQAFPLLKHLNLLNVIPPSWDLDHGPHDDSQSYPIVKYPHLTSLEIIVVDIEYLELFLLETKTHMPRLTELKLNYEQLKTVTEDFSRDATRRNCSKVKRLTSMETLVYSKEVYRYFPML